MRELFGQRSPTGVETTLFHDEDNPRPVIRTKQDVRPILAANRQARNDFDPRRAARTPMRTQRIASIPFVVMQQLCQMGLCEMTRHGGFRIVDERAFLRWLSDPDHAALRTDGGGRLA